LETLYDKTLLEHVVERIRAARRLDDIVIATTEAGADDAVADLARGMGIGVFRGSENDVLARFYGAATRFSAQVIVRVTADDPFKDPEIIDHAVELLREQALDYCSNTLEPTYPEGLDIEVFRFPALERAHREARLDSEREHVTPYIWKHPNMFLIHSFKWSDDLSRLRWTIDYERDLSFAREVYRRLYPEKRIFLFRDILELLAREPQLAALNAGVARNEGYQKSLAKEVNHE
jgi:spore coat polysaccharide biosynthesis protein SpsF